MHCIICTHRPPLNKQIASFPLLAKNNHLVSEISSTAVKKFGYPEAVILVNHLQLIEATKLCHGLGRMKILDAILIVELYETKK